MNGLHLSYTNKFTHIFTNSCSVPFFCRLIPRLRGYLLGATTASIVVKGVEISYLVLNGSVASREPLPTLVFLHGISGKKYDWCSMLAYIPRSWRIIALDLPGHGESGFNKDLNYSSASVGEILHEVSIHEMSSLLEKS